MQIQAKWVDVGSYRHIATFKTYNLLVFSDNEGRTWNYAIGKGRPEMAGTSLTNAKMYAEDDADQLSGANKRL